MSSRQFMQHWLDNADTLRGWHLLQLVGGGILRTLPRWNLSA
jgi:hypothetical protein